MEPKDMEFCIVQQMILGCLVTWIVIGKEV